MKSVVVTAEGAVSVPVTVPAGCNALIASAVIGSVVVTDNGTFGGVYEVRATLSSGKEAFDAYLSGVAHSADGLLCQLGRLHPTIPVQAGKTYMVVCENPLTAVLFFDNV